MTGSQEDPKPTPAQVLAALVAKRKEAAGSRAQGGRESERTAAARSAAKSKPALRK